MEETHFKFFINKRNENSLTHFKPIPFENIRKPKMLILKWVKHESMYLIYYWVPNRRGGWKILQNLKGGGGGGGVGISGGWKSLENIIAGVGWRKFDLIR